MKQALLAWRPRARLSEAKASSAQRLIALTSAGRPQWTPRDYGALSREGFARNAVAYRCVRMIAEACAGVRLVAFESGERASDHPLQKLIERPNPQQGRADLMEAFFGGLQTAGNAYLEAAVNENGAVAELYTLRPDRVKVVPGANGWPAAYDYSLGGRSLRIGRDAGGWMGVLHFKLLSPLDDHYGFSPLEAAACAIDAHNASGAWNKALLDNSARPSGALVYSSGKAGERLGQEQFDQLKAQLAAAHAGTAAAGRPLVLDGGLDWKPMSLSPAEMDFIEGRHASAREIALAFGVPPQLLGIPGDATYANYREANLAFWRQSVLPLVERACAAINTWLEPKFPGAVLRPDLESISALSLEREALWARLEAASFLEPDEKRRLAGLGR